MQNNRPKIGLALSGGAGRAVAHVAVLDVLKENGINPDIIVGCSSGAVVAASYAAGAREELMDFFKNLKLSRLWSLWKIRGSRGGIFNLDSSKEVMIALFRELNLEDLPIKVGISTADIETGNLVTLTSGSITRAIRASVAVPGLFQPEVINDRILLEGGLVNIVPTVPVRQLGADIVIGVDVAKAKFFYQKRMPLFRLIRRLRKMLGIHFVQHEIINPITSQLYENIAKEFGIKKRRIPNAFRIFFWAVDHSYDVEAEWNEERRACDIMISPPVLDTAKLEVRQSESIYAEGRKSALEALPKIKQLIADFEAKREKVEVRQ